MHAQRSHTHINDPVVHVWVHWIMLSWKHQNNPACTKNVSLESTELKMESLQKKSISSEPVICGCVLLCFKHGHYTLYSDMDIIHYIQTWTSYNIFKHGLHTLHSNMDITHYIQTWTPYTIFTHGHYTLTLYSHLDITHYIQTWTSHTIFKHGQYMLTLCSNMDITIFKHGHHALYSNMDITRYIQTWTSHTIFKHEIHTL